MKIEKILLLDERMLSRYRRLYKDEGMGGLAANNYQGSGYKLSGEQIQELKQGLDSKIYRRAEEVCEYGRERLKARYTAKGMERTSGWRGSSYKGNGRRPR
ncbi:MAG: hypothetical protein LBD58_10260 [Treponema sp.]|nr:hypothetical protein [Treponema sp.]